MSKSPFPGMDPYLEQQPYWGDFTPRFVTALANTMLAQLLPRYEVCVEEYLYVAHEEIRLHRVRPDMTLSTQAPVRRSSGTGAALLDLATEELEYPEAFQVAILDPDADLPQGRVVYSEPFRH